MNLIEFIDSLISDLSDYINDYKCDIRRTNSRLEKQDREIRIDELKKWKKSLIQIREEQLIESE